MSIKIWNIIGLMSGSSLDGVDIANCNFTVDEKDFGITKWEITHFKTFPYTSSILQQLKDAIHFNGKDLIEFDRNLGKIFGDMINEFCEENKIEPDLISSHGHTLFHNPEKGFTLQIGHPSSIVASTSYSVIGDFRSTDIALGGQGAPFAPIVDIYLFSNYQIRINLGGIVNLSFKSQKSEVAYDICPCNQVLNYLAEKLDKVYDEYGNIARAGKLNQSLYESLLNWDYFNKAYPKSLDNTEIQSGFIPIIDSYDIKVEDKMNTMVIVIATLIKNAISLKIPENKMNVLITGGGAHNRFLIEVLQNHLEDYEVIIPENKIVDYKEALLMSLMGLLRIYKKVNVIKEVTGSKVEHSAGAVYLGLKNSMNGY